jgi:two-component system phosphate regulon response regulator PhoB
MAGPKTRLLLVEDDPALAQLLRYSFEREGFQVSHTPSGEEALLLAHEIAPDIVLPDTANVPIIMLSARAEESDRVRGLETGADDYLTKPFSPLELIARVNAVLRRVRPGLAGVTLSYADLELDMSTHKVRRAGAPVAIGPTEFKLLRHFLEHPGRVFSRERLLDAVWGRDSVIEARTVDVHIRRLRKAINVEGARDIIRTVRSAGYALDGEA